MNHWLHGMFTALVTPFDEDGIDYGALERLILWQIAQGADGIVVGTATGESPTLSGAEREALCAAARQIAGRHYPVIAAVGSYSTAGTVSEIAAAEKAGASALLLRMPYYNRPTQAGLAAHALAAAEATGLEIILDNDPDRCGVEIAVETLVQLEGAANIVGILERRGDLVRCDRIARARDRRFMRLTGAAASRPICSRGAAGRSPASAISRRIGWRGWRARRAPSSTGRRRSCSGGSSRCSTCWRASPIRS